MRSSSKTEANPKYLLATDLENSFMHLSSQLSSRVTPFGLHRLLQRQTGLTSKATFEALCCGYMRPALRPQYVFLFCFVHVGQSKVQTTDTRNLLLNVESQSSVCPIPINYFPSPKCSAGIPNIPPRRQ